MSDLATQVSASVSGLKDEFNVITHNLANIGTAGFKRRCNKFSKLLAAQGAGMAEEIGDGFDLESVIDFSQGGMTETGRRLDFALSGRGFFVIETPEGQLYTRNGMFRLDQNGQIVDSAGRTVSGDSGPITVPPDVSELDIAVGKDGSISAGGQAIGKFMLVEFGEDESKLVAIGTSCYQMPEKIKPEAAVSTVVQQGSKEASNVQMVEELVDMLMITRLYEANMKFLSAKKDTSNSILGVAMG